MFAWFRKRGFTHTLVTDSWRRTFNLDNMQLPPYLMLVTKDKLPIKPNIWSKSLRDIPSLRDVSIINIILIMNSELLVPPCIPTKRSAQTYNLKTTHQYLPQLCSTFNKGVQEENCLEKSVNKTLRCLG